jgi:hypothetical protein
MLLTSPDDTMRDIYEWIRLSELDELVAPQRVALPPDPQPLDGREGVQAAVQMLHAGEITRREFFELCEEAANLVDAAA